ncbi:MAG: DUF4830 domain-containing protein [Clostridiales bacterium]|nr:DUF4830 domain-containing protein [Clostridiales bacterium]
MFIFTTKINKKKLILMILAIALLISAIICICPTRLLSGNEKSDKAMAEQAISKKAGSKEEQVTFLENYGWKVENQPIEMCEVQLPDEFDEVYNSYNDIQKKQGCDLLKYRGKTVMLYTYKVLNYPTGEKDARANLLVYNDKIIGGDICSLSLNGFMHGFEMPKSEKTVKSESEKTNEQNTDTTEKQGGTKTEQGKQTIKGLFKEE